MTPLEIREQNRKEWSERLDDVIWAYKIAYKTPIGSTPYRPIYGKTCHLPVKLEHHTYWATKFLNSDLDRAGKKQKFQLDELEVWWQVACKSSRMYKKRTKRFRDE